MKKLNKIFALLIALVMVIGMLPSAAFATVTADHADRSGAGITGSLDGLRGNGTGSGSQGVTIKEIENPGVDLRNNGQKPEQMKDQTYAPDELVDVIVVMEDKSLLDRGYTTAQIASVEGGVANVNRQLFQKQEDLLTRINAVVNGNAATYGLKGGMEITAKFHYNVVFSGMAITVPYGALAEINALDGVKKAFVATVFSVPEDMSNVTVGADMYETRHLFGSAQVWEELGITGEGMRIAILDTGLDTDHPAFVETPPLTEDSLTVEEIESVLPTLNAYQWYLEENGVELTAEDLYISGKIPFGYSYGYNNPDVTHDRDVTDTHGTHVAGTAAVNAVEGSDVVGVAPDAQIIAMKVFVGSGASSIYFFAAIEDAFRLNVDVMNLSLGSSGGFTEEDELFNKIMETDMIVVISAGNSYSSAFQNSWGTNTNLTSDPDNGIVGFPATTVGATVVASVENSKFMTQYFAIPSTGENFAYSDASLYDSDAIQLAFCLLGEGEGTDYEYVMIPNYGAAEDYEGLDVAGKIAVVQRGNLSFVDKQINAYDAGAAAIIVYDNVDEDLSMYMQNAYKLPNIFVTKATGEALAAAADSETGVGTLTVMPFEKTTVMDNPTAGQMSDFSSWGVTPDLRLVPDVTAPGGNIYSTVNGGGYDMMSGTSMAAPHITGMSALVLQHLRAEHPEVLEHESHTVAEALIMSTADPVVEYEANGMTVPYSPRKQGAGSANVYAALSSAAYLTVNGGKPSVSMGDDPDRTGAYTFSFEINNLTNEEQTYVLDGTVLTDYVDLAYADYGYYFMGERSLPLDAEVTFTVAGGGNAALAYDMNQDGRFDLADVQALLDYVNGLPVDLADGADYDLNGDGKLNTADVQSLKVLLDSMPVESVDGMVVVPANGRRVVTATVTLTEDDMFYMDYFYENGIYVDGFIRCYSTNEGVDLSLPFMGFYGDWSDARLFDSTELMDTDVERGSNVVFTEFGSSYYALGLNPYIGDEAYDPAHDVLSPNGDGYQDSMLDMYLYLMRGAKYLDFNWVDSDGTTVLYNTTAGYATKAYYLQSAGQIYPFRYSYYIYSDFDEEGYPIADFYDLSQLVDPANPGEVKELTLTVDGYLDDGDLVPDQSFALPIVIDNQGPQLLGGELIYDSVTDGRTLRLAVGDNYDIAAVIPLTLTGDPYEYITVNTKQPGDEGETAVIDIDVSGYDSSFVIALCDYGCNETYIQITFEGELNADPNSFYGYRRYSVLQSGNYLYPNSLYNGWYSFADPAKQVQHTSVRYETEVAAAEYIDGYVVGVDVNGTIFANVVGDWSNRTIVGTLELEGELYTALDMAFDYTTNTLYILTDELSSGSGGHLIAMDYLTGELTDLGTIGMRYGSQPLTLACDNQGVLYTVNYSQWASYGYESSALYTIEVSYDEEWDETTVTATKVGDTGYSPAYYQSMTVDHATNKLYWAAYQGYTGSSVLYEVDKTTGELTEVGLMGDNSEMTGLFKPFTPRSPLYPTEAVELSGLVLSENSLTMAAGMEAQLVSRPVPYYAEITGTVTWSTSDDTVAVVNENGVVTAVGEGTATITAELEGKTASCTVRVVEIDAAVTLYDAGMGQAWLAFNANSPADAGYVDAIKPTGANDSFVTATYTVDGVIYAYDSSGGFYKIDAETMDGVRLGANNAVNGQSGVMLALAFNPADGHLYGIAQTGTFFETYFSLVRIDPSNGDFVTVGDLSDYMPMNLAVTPDGTFCFVTDLFDYETYKASTVVMRFTLEDDEIVVEDAIPVAGFESGSGNYNSLVYSSENKGLFWADYYGRLLWIDPVNGDSVNLGFIGETANYPQNVCLFEIPAADPEVNFAAPEAVTMADSFLMLVGGSVSAGVKVAPWNARAQLTYAVEDETVATVDEDGTITALSAGVTTLTVSCEGFDDLTATITVVESAGTLYGFLISDFVYSSNLWLEIPDAASTEAEAVHDGEEDEYTPFSGAYYDGYVYTYGQDQFGQREYRNFLVKYNANDYYDYEMIGQVHVTIRDMEFDYTTGTMYAVVNDSEMSGALAQVDLENAEVAIIGDSGHTLAAMTVDGEGNIYAIGEDANPYRLDKATGEATLIGATGVASVSLFQSMHYDLNSGNTYWTQVARDYSNGLYLVDLTTGVATCLGTVGTGAEVSVLYTIPENAPEVPASVEADGVSLTGKTTVVAGETVTLHAARMPFSVAEVTGTLTWTSSDETVATVESGVVTGVSAGTAVITATVNGVSASCTVTVTAEARRFYAYDEWNGQWISFVDDNDVVVEREDAEDEETITASVYVDGALYSYTADGYFWSVDPDTFERTLIGEGISGMTVTATVMNWWGDDYEIEVPVNAYGLTYDAATGKTYGMFMAEDEENWVFVAVICEVNLATGEAEIVYMNADIQPGNLLVKNGRAFFVDTYVVGMLNYVDLYDENAEAVQYALVNNYWGDYNTGRSLIEDPLTGVVYALRDNRGGQTSLWTLNLGDADAVAQTGIIGEGTVLNSLFIR